MLGLILEHHPHGPLANLCWVLASSCHRPILSQDLEPPTFPGRFNSSPFAVGKSDSTKRRHSIGRRWGHFRSSFGPHVGPVQSVIPKLEVEAGGGFVDAFQQVSLGCRSAPPIWQLRNIHRNSMGREGWQTLSIARVYRPPVATVIRPPGQPVGRLGISEQYVSSISSFLGVEQRAVRRESAGGSSRPRSRSGSWRWRAGRVRCCRGSGRRRGRATPRRRGSR